MHTAPTTPTTGTFIIISEICNIHMYVGSVHSIEDTVLLFFHFPYSEAVTCLASKHESQEKQTQLVKWTNPPVR